MSQRYVWVLELGIFGSRGHKITKWEPWESFNTRAEAVERRDCLTVPKTGWRIVKYVPAQANRG